MKFDSDSQISENLNSEFDWFQQEERQLCIEHGLDPLVMERFVKPEVSFLTMRELRKGFEAGFDLMPFMKLRPDILKELRKAKISGVELMPYIKDGYQAEQLKEIRHALEKGIDPKDYITNEYMGLSIREIAAGIEHGVDVAYYAKTTYSFAQMRQLRLGMENHVDYELYGNPLYSPGQMEEIRLGLQESLPVEEYKSFVFTEEEMKKRRLQLKKQMDNPVMQRHYRSEDITIRLKGASVLISEEGFKAEVILTRDYIPVRKVDLLLWLRQNEIYSGINEENLERLLSPNVRPGKYEIAKGRQAQRGDDGYYEYFIDIEAAIKDKDFIANIENFREARWFEAVKKGQRIALYHKATEGRDGYFVNGQIIPACRGYERPVLIGRGIHSEQGNAVYFADYDGKIDIDGNKINIIPLLEIEDLNSNDESVDFDGFVHVSGSVKTGSSIKASRGILIDGTAYNCELISGEDVVLRRGMTGDGRGSIEAKGNIVGGFFEEACLTAGGSVYSDSCLNCYIQSSEKLVIDGKIGRITGGSSYGCLGVSAKELGNEACLKTEISVGVKREKIEELKKLEDELKEVNGEVGLLKNSYQKLLWGYQGLSEKEQELQLRLERALYEKHKERNAIEQKWQRLSERVETEQQAAIYAINNLYENVMLSVNGNRMLSTPASFVKISGVRRLKIEGMAYDDSRENTDCR